MYRDKTYSKQISAIARRTTYVECQLRNKRPLLTKPLSNGHCCSAIDGLDYPWRFVIHVGLSYSSGLPGFEP